MSQTAIRIAVIVSVLMMFMALASMWLGTSALPGPPDAPLHNDWVRTKDGWERSNWQHTSHRPPLHPGLVAAFMALASLAFLVAASPSQASTAKSPVDGEFSTQAGTAGGCEGTRKAAASWTPRVVAYEPVAYEPGALEAGAYQEAAH